MPNEMNGMEWVHQYLPSHAELLLAEPNHQAYLRSADFDGDGAREIAAAYRLQGEIYVLILKNHRMSWRVVGNIKGNGYGISDWMAAPITSKRRRQLIVGWQTGAIWSRLAIYEWTPRGWRNVAPANLYYSRLEVEDMPGRNGTDGKWEIALWTHDTGKAYKINVYRWSHGKLVPALDVYPYYFKKVVSYYQQKTEEMPNAAFYWYYLADAQFKAGLLREALRSIEGALRLNPLDPWRESLEMLKREILSPAHERAQSLYPASTNTINGMKWGYINSQGKIIIPPQYDHADDFQDNGLAIVQFKNHAGMIDSSGAFLIEPKYQAISPFSEGRAVVMDTQGFKVIDETGRELTSKAYSFIGSYQDQRAVFSGTNSEGKYLYGYLDLQGKEAFPLQYEMANDFKGGKALVRITENEYALIGQNGEKLQTFPYANMGNLSEGLMSFQQTFNDKLGYVDEKGNVVISPQFVSAQPFQDGRAVVNMADGINNQYGLIDQKGNYLIQPKYNDIRLLGEKRAAVGTAIDQAKPYVGSTFAIANTDGHFLTDFMYESVEDYNNGLSSASRGQSTFFIDLNGRLAKGYPVVHGTGTLKLEGDLIKAYVDQRVFYYDRTGKLIWKPNTIIPMNERYRILEQKYSPNKDYLVYYPQIEGMKNQYAQNRVNQELKKQSQVKPIGSQEKLDYTYTGDFAIEYFKKSLLVLQLNGYYYSHGAAHGMPSEIFVHIDLNNGKLFELKDLFKPGSNYVQVLSDIIAKQIQDNPDYSYIFPDSYKGIKANQPFYVTEEALAIYFSPYEIAPYAAGFPTFKIPYMEIMEIIDVNGEFWKSFH